MLPHQLKKAVAEAEAHAAAAAGQQGSGKGVGGSSNEDGGQGISAGEADRLRQLQRDRAQLQLRKLQADAGLISKQAAVVAAAGLEWLYDNPKESREVQEVQREAYLLGKPIEAPSFSSQTQSRADQIASAGVQTPSGRPGGGGEQIKSRSLFLAGESLLRANDDTLRKLREDPLFLIKQAEIAQKRAKESNPLYRQQQEEKQRREEEERRKKEAYEEEKRRKKILKKEEKKARKRAKKEKRRRKEEEYRNRSSRETFVKAEEGRRIKHEERETNGETSRYTREGRRSYDGSRGRREIEEDWRRSRRESDRKFSREREIKRESSSLKVNGTKRGGRDNDGSRYRDVSSIDPKKSRRRDRYDSSSSESSSSSSPSPPVREKRTRRRRDSSSSNTHSSSSSSSSSSSPSPDRRKHRSSSGLRRQSPSRHRGQESLAYTTTNGYRYEGELGEQEKFTSALRIKRERRLSSLSPFSKKHREVASSSPTKKKNSTSSPSFSSSASSSSTGDGGRSHEEAKEKQFMMIKKEPTEVNHPGGPKKQARVLGPARPEAAEIQAEAFGVTDDIAPPEAIQEKARLLQEKKEAEQRAAIAARNAAIDQAVKEQRERDEKLRAAASKESLEDKLRRMKEEGQRHEEDKARRHELLSVKEKLQEQLEQKWRTKSEGGELLNSIQRQAFLGDGKTVADFLQRRRARRRKDLDDGHDLLASNAEQR